MVSEKCRWQIQNKDLINVKYYKGKRKCWCHVVSEAVICWPTLLFPPSKQWGTQRLLNLYWCHIKGFGERLSEASKTSMGLRPTTFNGFSKASHTGGYEIFDTLMMDISLYSFLLTKSYLIWIFYSTFAACLLFPKAHNPIPTLSQLDVSLTISIF